jgi:hypothetical protein
MLSIETGETNDDILTADCMLIRRVTPSNERQTHSCFGLPKEPKILDEYIAAPFRPVYTRTDRSIGRQEPSCHPSS